MVNIYNLKHKKQEKEKIVGITAYDLFTSLVIKDLNVDFILVGDSLNMVVKGEDNTLSTTLDDIIYHTKIVSKIIKDKIIVADMPFLTYHISKEQALENAGKIIQQTEATAVKIEGGEYRIETIEFLIKNGIPVMGHLGLTPQMLYTMGGYKIFGKNNDERKILIEEALKLQEKGVFALILEGVKEDIAKEISEMLEIPVIGIGAGRFVDGQILVISDILGMHDKKLPKFARKYVDLLKIGQEAVLNYINDVRTLNFPSDKEVY